MATLIIAQIDQIHDSEGYQLYGAAAQPSIAAAGGPGIVLASDGNPTVLEGDWRGAKMVVLKFASREKALEWYNSESYQAAARLRQAASRGSLIMIDTRE